MILWHGKSLFRMHLSEHYPHNLWSILDITHQRFLNSSLGSLFSNMDPHLHPHALSPDYSTTSQSISDFPAFGIFRFVSRVYGSFLEICSSAFCVVLNSIFIQISLP